MKFKVTWLEERVDVIDAADIKAAEVYMVNLVKMLENRGQKAKLLEIRKFNPPTSTPLNEEPFAGAA